MANPSSSSRPDPGLGPFAVAGAPVAGTDSVWTLTIGGTPTGGSFKLRWKGRTTGAIAWSATNTTLRDNVDTALESLLGAGAGNVTTAVGTMTAGIGTLTITFAAALGKRAVPPLSVASNDLTGTAPTVVVAETTPGVDATARGAIKGALLSDTVNGVLYVNTGSAGNPTWTKVGTQT